MRRRNLSLRFTLLLILGASTLLVWLTVIALVYRQSSHEVEEVFDANLAIEARVLAALLRHEVGEELEQSRKLEQLLTLVSEDQLRGNPALTVFLARQAKKGKDKIELEDFWDRAVHDYEAKLFLAARYFSGEVLLQTPGAPDIGHTATGYFDTEKEGVRWRGFAIDDPATGFYVQVGEQVEIRRELAESVVFNTLTPILIAFPIQLLLVWLGVSRGLQPLVRLTREVDRRDPGSLDPVPSRDAPREALPLVEAINRLFGCIRSAMENERRFTADAAHELRTPLAALKTNVQVAVRKTEDATMRHCLGRIGEGVDRAAHLVDQLLTLARAEARDRDLLEKRRIDLRTLALEVVSDHSQKALDNEIDLGLDAPSAVEVGGDGAYLQILLRNLVDNAIRYTQEGGQVTVRAGAESGEPYLEVADNGPGIPPQERERMFARFHRGQGVQATGSGLGMSIVERIAELHGARIALDEGLDGRGLRVRVSFAALP
jgi:two-component system sensor histidine kinase QseC